VVGARRLWRRMFHPTVVAGNPPVVRHLNLTADQRPGASTYDADMQSLSPTKARLSFLHSFRSAGVTYQFLRTCHATIRCYYVEFRRYLRPPQRHEPGCDQQPEWCCPPRSSRATAGLSRIIP
jgi:hypothetical protein